jgi:hypothetical protein
MANDKLDQQKSADSNQDPANQDGATTSRPTGNGELPNSENTGAPLHMQGAGNGPDPTRNEGAPKVDVPAAPKSGDDANPQGEVSGNEIPVAGHFAVQPTRSEFFDFTMDSAGSASEEEVQLRSEIESTKATLYGMFPDPASVPRQKKAFNEYMEKLFWIAKNGLQAPGQPKIATSALRSFQNEVLWREGGRVKNGYMKKLGQWAVMFSGAALVLYIGLLAVRAMTPLGNMHAAFDSFFLLWIGAMVGCWLSFGIRNVQLTFAELGRPESDLLQPNVRLVFTGVLALTLGLIFKVGVVQIEIGELKTLDLAKPTVALVIGLFCGIAEQALSRTVGGRASQFMEQISK